MSDFAISGWKFICKTQSIFVLFQKWWKIFSTFRCLWKCPTRSLMPYRARQGKIHRVKSAKWVFVWSLLNRVRWICYSRFGSYHRHYALLVTFVAVDGAFEYLLEWVYFARRRCWHSLVNQLAQLRWIFDFHWFWGMFFHQFFDWLICCRCCRCWWLMYLKGWQLLFLAGLRGRLDQNCLFLRWLHHSGRALLFELLLVLVEFICNCCTIVIILWCHFVFSFAPTTHK